MKSLLRLYPMAYPRAWRERYGEEFAALLEDSGGGWRVVLDVVYGGMKMRMMSTDFRLVLWLGLAGLVVAAVASWQMPNRYRSEAVAEISVGADAEAGTLAETIITAESTVLSRTSLSNLIQAPDLNLYSKDRERMPLEDVIEQMKARDLRITVSGKLPGGAQAFKVSYVGDSPASASHTTKRVLDGLVQALDGNKAVSQVVVLDPPSLPVRQSSPNRYLITLAGLAGGMVLGILIAGVRRWPQVALMGLGGAVIAGAMSFAIPDKYISTAMLRFQDAESAERITGRVFGDDEMLMNFIHEGSGETTRDDVSFRRTSRNVTVRVSSRDRLHAQAAVQGLISALYVSAQVRSQTEAEKMFRVVDPPSLSIWPVWPNRPVVAATGLVAGLVLALLLRVSAVFLKPRTA